MNARSRLWVTAAASVVASLLACPVQPFPASAAVQSKNLCVGPAQGCYRTLQGAIGAAHDRDSILISAGVFAGGVIVDKSVRIVGAGSRLTTIRGGGPVLTLGRFNARREPSVSLRGVTITGGVTHSSAMSTALFGKAGVLALGGGVEIAPAAQFRDGASVTIRDSVISGNRAQPSATVPSGLPCGRTCPFGLAGGGGIDNWGKLTLINTIVRDNTSGGPIASDADGGGIYSPQGSLNLVNSSVTANRAFAQRPNGRYAEAGGISALSTAFFTSAKRPPGRLTIRSSRITGNEAHLLSDFPSEVEAHAQGGGLVIGGNDDCRQANSGCVQADIVRSSFDHNTVTAGNSTGAAVAFGGGINNDGRLAIGDSRISANRVSARVEAGSAASAFADSGGLGMGGYATINRTYLTDNTVAAAAGTGDAVATFAGMSSGTPGLPTRLLQDVIADNKLTASTKHGTATVQGAGVGHLDGPLYISQTLIVGNIGVARGASDVAQGGGIANFTGLSALLTLGRDVISGNQLTTTGVTPAEGGGLYTAGPIARHHTVIIGNRPNQCSGNCS